MRTTRHIDTVAHLCGTVILVLTAAYLLLAVLPFYGNGIHLHSYAEVAGSHVDVKGYPPFAWSWIGGPAQGAAMLSAALTPLASLLLTPILLVALGVKWHTRVRSGLALWTVTAAINIVTMAVTWQSLGVIVTWLAD
ncbi:MAG: hypothetical protein ACUVX1_01780 [Chloroflexota bacterium]